MFVCMCACMHVSTFVCMCAFVLLNSFMCSLFDSFACAVCMFYARTPIIHSLHSPYMVKSHDSWC